MATKHKINDSKILKYFNLNWSDVVISKKLGISSGGVFQARKRLGLMKFGKRPTITVRVSPSPKIIISLSKNGMKDAEIANKFSMSISGVRKIKHRNGFKTSPYSPNKGKSALDKHKQTIEKLLSEDVSIQKISGILGVSNSNLHYFCKLRGINTKINYRKYKDADIVRLFNGGNTKQNIGLILNLSSDTVRLATKRLNLFRPRTKMKDILKFYIENKPLFKKRGKKWANKYDKTIVQHLFREKNRFKQTIKKQAFQLSQGICGYCHKFISDDWKAPSYHHILPVCRGGLGVLENCMVLHRDCHNDPIIYKELHGFNKATYYPKTRKELEQLSEEVA
jgi:hypothetical protein